MTQKQCESEILKRLSAIWDIYHKYNPSGKYLSMFIDADSVDETLFSANNEYWDKDGHAPINLVKLDKQQPKTLPIINIRKDETTGLTDIKVNGVVKYEHLADDEADEVLRQLLIE